MLRNYYMEGLKLDGRQIRFSCTAGSNLAAQIEKDITWDDFTAAFCENSNEHSTLSQSATRRICWEVKQNCLTAVLHVSCVLGNRGRCTQAAGAWQSAAWSCRGCLAVKTSFFLPEVWGRPSAETALQTRTVAALLCLKSNRACYMLLNQDQAADRYRSQMKTVVVVTLR